jgi:tetratricopeptide (TPR) repeat protein
LAAEERNANTARVDGAELESILRRQQLAQTSATGNGGDGLSATYTGETYAAPTTSSLVLPPTAQPPAAAARTKKARWWPAILLTLLFVGTAIGLLIYFWRHRDANPAGVSVTNTDQRAVVLQQLNEARTLLANGSVSDAIDRLHSVINLDPSNLEARRMLGAALLRSGRRRQAIDEYFIAAQKGPQDVDTLQTLATLQFQEQLYADAVDSYRRLATALGAGTLPPADEMNYADALRLAGYTEDSRTEYQKLAAGAAADIAAVAKQRLAQLPPQGATGLPLNARAVPASSVATNNAAATLPSQPLVTATPAIAKPAPTAARTDPDAEYALGVSIVAGRDPKSLPRAELLRALGAAQRGAQGGQHRDQASKLAERLGREFDRRKSSGIQ